MASLSGLSVILLLIDTVFHLVWPTLLSLLTVTGYVIATALWFYRSVRAEVKSLGHSIPDYLDFLEQDGLEMAGLIAQLRVIDRETLAFALHHLRHRHAMLANRLGYLGIATQLGLAPALVSGLIGLGVLLSSVRTALEPIGVSSSSPVVPLVLFILAGSLAGLHAGGLRTVGRHWRPRKRPLRLRKRCAHQRQQSQRRSLRAVMLKRKQGNWV